ncbi:MAG TPA: RodZ domain-containing protein [Rhodanobacteraceae bacterium]
MTDTKNTDDLFNAETNSSAARPDAPGAPAVTPAADSHATASIGATLLSARTTLGLSLVDCGRSLHLPVKVLRRLEADDFGATEDYVFLRGALRGYARFLGLPADSCDAALRAAAPSEQPALVSVARVSPARWLLQRYGTAATYIVLTATIAVPLVLLGLRGGLHQPAVQVVSLDQTPSPAPAASPVAHKAQAPVASPSPSPDATPFRASIAPLAAMGFDPADVSDITGAASAPLAPAAVAGQHTLTVTATGDCWYEITDANGNKIASGMLHAGDTQTWHSAGMLHVTLGNASAVSVTRDGQPLALDAFRHANVARFEVFAPAGTGEND